MPESRMEAISSSITPVIAESDSIYPSSAAVNASRAAATASGSLLCNAWSMASCALSTLCKASCTAVFSVAAWRARLAACCAWAGLVNAGVSLSISGVAGSATLTSVVPAVISAVSAGTADQDGAAKGPTPTTRPNRIAAQYFFFVVIFFPPCVVYLLPVD